MAVAEIIGAAIGILLLVIVAYLIVGGTISVAETVATAQKDLTQLNEARLRTDMSLIKSDITIADNEMVFSVENSGNEMISNFDHIDVYTYNNTGLGYLRYTYDSDNTGNAGLWQMVSIDNDFVHPNQLDPGEKMWIKVGIPDDINPVWVLVSSSNGVSAQTTIT